MGMFDELRCKYPLPVVGANALVYQTKSLDCFMDYYEIREDGTLWHEEYDIEDCSDPTATGLMRLYGMATRVRKRWEPMPTFVGEVQFYSSFTPGWRDWIEWSAYFVNGTIRHLHLLRHDPPPSADAVDRPAANSGTPSTRDESSSADPATAAGPARTP